MLCQVICLAVERQLLGFMVETLPRSSRMYAATSTTCAIKLLPFTGLASPHSILSHGSSAQNPFPIALEVLIGATAPSRSRPQSSPLSNRDEPKYRLNLDIAWKTSSRWMRTCMDRPAVGGETLLHGVEVGDGGIKRHHQSSWKTRPSPRIVWEMSSCWRRISQRRGRWRATTPERVLFAEERRLPTSPWEPSF